MWHPGFQKYFLQLLFYSAGQCRDQECLGLQNALHRPVFPVSSTDPAFRLAQSLQGRAISGTDFALPTAVSVHNLFVAQCKNEL